MAISAGAERLGEHASRVALLLARARVKDHAHLYRIIEDAHPSVVRSAATVWRYLYDPPTKPNYHLVKALAEALETDEATVLEVIRETRV